MVNLASEENAKKINIRFKELETEILELHDTKKIMLNTIANLSSRIDNQTQLIQLVLNQVNGTGPTEKNND